MKETSLKKRFLILRMVLAFMLSAAVWVTAACAGVPAPKEATLEQSSAGAAPTVPAAAQTPTPQGEAFRQSGKLNALLLDDAALRACVVGYQFIRGERLCVEVSASNDNGNPAVIWLLFQGINGWDVQNQQQSMQAIHLAPGEARTQEILFDLTEREAAYLQLDALTQITFVTEGYVDSTNYEFAMVERVVDLPDAPNDYVQRFPDTAEQTLLDNAFLTIAYCGQDEQSGDITLYYAVKTPVEGAHVKLYPLENGVFDTQRYPVLDEQDLSKLTKRLITFKPAKQEAGLSLDGFYAVAQGAAMRPDKLNLPGAQEAAALQSVPEHARLIVEADLLRVYFDGQTNRFLVENLTDDQVLTLENAAEFQLDGQPVRANPQSIPCFPRSITAFRVSGRGVGEDGVERSRVINENSRSVSIGWNVFALTQANHFSEPEAVGLIETGEILLKD